MRIVIIKISKKPKWKQIHVRKVKVVSSVDPFWSVTESGQTTQKRTAPEYYITTNSCPSNCSSLLEDFRSTLCCCVTTQMRSRPVRDTPVYVRRRDRWTIWMGGAGRSGDGLRMVSRVSVGGAGLCRVCL